jgi:hypothetical protein
VGDGYHNYLNVGVVSCSCLGLVAPGQTVLAASMRMRPSRVFGTRNIYSADRNGVVSQAIRVDMVCSERQCGSSACLRLLCSTLPWLWLQLCRVTSACGCESGRARCRDTRLCLSSHTQRCRACDVVGTQSYAFNNNPLLEKEDWGAPALFSNIGTVSGAGGTSPTLVRVDLNANVLSAVNCSRELQFRWEAFNVSSGFPFTDFDDRCECAGRGVRGLGAGICLQRGWWGVCVGWRAACVGDLCG